MSAALPPLRPAAMPPTTTARSHSTFRDDLSGWENDFDHSVVPPNKEAEWKPKNPSWDETLRDAVETETTSGFEWEDQLALRATSELMSPSRMQRAMGKILQRGYDQQRAVPLAVDLARVPSPNRPVRISQSPRSASLITALCGVQLESTDPTPSDPLPSLIHMARETDTFGFYRIRRGKA